MKNFRFLISLILAAVLCFSMCACGQKTVQNSAYNTDDLKDGYTLINTVNGVEFCVPSDLKSAAINEENYEDNLDADIETATIEMSSPTDYLLVNKAEGFVLVSNVDVDSPLANTEKTEDVLEAVDKDFIGGLTNCNNYVKSDDNGITKVFFSADITAKELEFENVDEATVYKGYVALIENKDGIAIGLMAFFKGDSKSNIVSAKYIAKSLKFNNKNIADKSELTSTTKEPTNDDKNNETESSNTAIPDKSPAPTFNAKLKDFKIKIEGREISIPLKVSDFEEQFGFTVDEMYNDVTVGENKYCLCSLVNDEKKIQVKVVNTETASEIPIKDCYIFAFTADKFDIYGYGSDFEAPKVSIVLPQNVQVYKTTMEEVISAYGEPTETRNDEASKNIYLTWKLSEDTFDFYTKMEIVVEKETNLVSEFIYGRMPE